MRLFNADKITESLPKFEAAVRTRPDQALYHAYLGWARLAAFGPEWADPARDALAHALALDPDLAEAHSMLGQLAATQNDAATARKHLERSLELQPIQPDAVELLLQAYQRLNDPKGAEGFLRKLVAALGERAQPSRDERKGVGKGIAGRIGPFGTESGQPRPAQVGMVERLVRSGAHRRFEFRQGFGDLVSVEETHGLAECQLGAQGIRRGRRGWQQGAVVALPQERIGENPGCVVDGCAQSIEPGPVSGNRINPCHGGGREFGRLGRTGGKDLRGRGIAGHAQRFVEALAPDGQVGAQDGLSRSLAGRVVDSCARHVLLRFESEGSQADVQGAGILHICHPREAGFFIRG